MTFHHPSSITSASTDSQKILLLIKVIEDLSLTIEDLKGQVIHLNEMMKLQDMTIGSVSSHLQSHDQHLDTHDKHLESLGKVLDAHATHLEAHDKLIQLLEEGRK